MKLSLLVAVIVSLLLSGCAAIEKMEERVCSEENEEIRMVLIKEIQKIKPWYPDDGACWIERKVRKVIDLVV